MNGTGYGMHLKYDVDIVEPQRVCCSGWAAMVCGPSLWMLLALRDDDVGVSTSRKPESRFLTPTMSRIGNAQGDSR